MKLILLGVILILVLLVIKISYKENFRREGFHTLTPHPETSPITGFNDKYKLSKEPSYKESRTRFSLIDTLLSAISLNVTKPEVKKEDIKGGSLMIYEEEEAQPLSHIENSAIIDPEAADLEASRSQDEDATLTEAGAKYAAADENLKNNFLSVSDKDPIYQVAAFTTNESTTKENVMNVCADFSWQTETGTADGGWSRVPLPEKPCVGFYSHTGSREKNEDGQYVEKWTILVSCDDNDCDTINPTLQPLQSGLDAMPADGETIWPGYPNTDVDKVWRLKSTNEGGTVRTRGRVSLENSFEEVSNVINVEIGEELKEDEAEITETQALNKCGIRGLKTKDGNECIGVILKDGRYRYLYKSISNYEPSETIGDIFRKLIWGTSNQNIDYPPVTTETYGLFSSRSILKPSVKEEYKNYLDKNTDNLITKRGTINAKQYCNNSQDCMGYYSEKTDPEQYYFLKGALKQYRVGTDGITKILMLKEKDDSGNNTRASIINDDFDENLQKQEEFIKTQKAYFASLATIKQYYDPNVTGENVILDGFKQGDYTLLKSTLTDCHLDMERKDPNGQPINYSIFPENSTAFAKGQKLKDSSDPDLGKHRKPLCIGIAVEKVPTGGNKYHFMRFKSNHMEEENNVVKEIAPDDTYEQVYLHKSHYKQGAISSSTATIIMVRDTIKLVHKKVKESLYRLITASTASGEQTRKNNITSGVNDGKKELKKMYDAYKELNAEILVIKGKGQSDEDIENLYTTQWQNEKDKIQEECEKMVAEILFYNEFSKWEVHLKNMFDDIKKISNNVLSMKDMMVNKNATRNSMKAKNDEIKQKILQMKVQQLSYQTKYDAYSWNDSKVKSTIHNKFKFLDSDPNGRDQLKNLWVEKRKDYLKGYTYEGTTGSTTVDGLYQKYVMCKDKNRPVYFYNGTPPNITKFCYGVGEEENIITNAYNNERASPRPVPESTSASWRCNMKTPTGGACNDDIIKEDDFDISKPLINTAEWLEKEADNLNKTYTKKSADFEKEIMVQYDYNPTGGIERSNGSLLDIGSVPTDAVYGNLEYALKQCHETPGCVGISKFDNTWTVVDAPTTTVGDDSGDTTAVDASTDGADRTTLTSDMLSTRTVRPGVVGDLIGTGTARVGVPSDGSIATPDGGLLISVGGIVEVGTSSDSDDTSPELAGFVGSMKEGFGIADISDEDKSWGFYKIINLIREGGETREHAVGPVKKIWRHTRYTDGLARLDKSYPNCREFCGQQLGLKCLGAKDKDGNPIFGEGSADEITGCEVAASPEKMSCKCADISPSMYKDVTLNDNSNFLSMSCPASTKQIAYCTDADGTFKNWKNIVVNNETVTTVNNPDCASGELTVGLECTNGYFNFPDDAIHLRPENSNLYNTGSCLNGSRILVKNDILRGKTGAALSGGRDIALCKEGCNKLGAQFIEVTDVAGVRKCVCTRCINIDNNIKGENIEYTEANIKADGTFIDWQTETKCDKIDTDSHQGGGENTDGVLHYFLNLANKFKDVKIYSDCQTEDEKREAVRIANMGRWIATGVQGRLQPICQKFKYNAHPNYGIPNHVKATFMIYFKVSDMSVDSLADDSAGDPTDDFQVFEKLALNQNKFIAIMKIKEKNDTKNWKKGEFVFLENKDDDGGDGSGTPSPNYPTTNTIFTHNSKTYFYEGVVNFNNVASRGPPSGAVELDGVWRNNTLYYDKIHEHNTNPTRSQYDNGDNFILDNLFICNQLGANLTTTSRNLCETDHNWCRSSANIVSENTEKRNLGVEAQRRDITSKWSTLGDTATNMYAQSWWKESDYSILKNACKKASEKTGGLDKILEQSFNDTDVDTYEFQSEKDKKAGKGRKKYQNSNSFLGNSISEWDQHLKMRQSPCWPFNFTNDERACYSPSGGLINEMGESGETLGDTFYNGNNDEKICGPNASGPGNWTKERVNYWKNWWWDEICKGTDQMWSESRKEQACRMPHPDSAYKSDEQKEYEEEREIQKYNVYCGRTGGGSNNLTTDETTIFFGEPYGIRIDPSDTNNFNSPNIYAKKWIRTSVDDTIYEAQGKSNITWWDSVDQISGKWYLKVSDNAGKKMMSFYKNLDDAIAGTENKKIKILSQGPQSIPFLDSYYKTTKSNACDHDTIKDKINKDKTYDKLPQNYYAFNITDDQSGSVSGGKFGFNIGSVYFQSPSSEQNYPAGQYYDPSKKFQELAPIFRDDRKNNSYSSLYNNEKKRMPDFVGPLNAFDDDDTSDANDYEKKVKKLVSTGGFVANAQWQKNQVSNDVFWICKEGTVENCISKLRDPNATCDTYTPPVGYQLKDGKNTIYCASSTCTNNDRDTCTDKKTNLSEGQDCAGDDNCASGLSCDIPYPIKLICKKAVGKFYWFDSPSKTTDYKDFFKITDGIFTGDVPANSGLALRGEVYNTKSEVNNNDVTNVDYDTQDGTKLYWKNLSSFSTGFKVNQTYTFTPKILEQCEVTPKWCSVSDEPTDWEAGGTDDSFGEYRYCLENPGDPVCNEYLDLSLDAGSGFDEFGDSIL